MEQIYSTRPKNNLYSAWSVYTVYIGTENYQTKDQKKRRIFMFIHIHVCAHTQTCRKTDIHTGTLRQIHIYSYTQVATPTKIHTGTHMYNTLNKGTQMLTLTWIYACMCMHLSMYTDNVTQAKAYTHAQVCTKNVHTHICTHLSLTQKGQRKYWLVAAIFLLQEEVLNPLSCLQGS